MAKTLHKPSLYDTGYVAWLQEQVNHLRAGRLRALDVENVAEELESLMKKERRQLGNRLEVLILHLLKWDHQPDQRANRWRATVAEQRRRLGRLLQDSPSLKHEVVEMCRQAYPGAAQGAAIETLLSPSVFPPTLPYSLEEIFVRELPAAELPEPRSTRKKRP
jgi:hypothetical protein